MGNKLFREPNDIDRGGLRRLTPGEIRLATSLYGFSIKYPLVWVHRDGYLPFNMQFEYAAMTPNGEMYFQEALYEPDFSKSTQSQDDISRQHIFMHEMMHIWQYQHGMMVKLRGMFSWAVDYSYDLDKVRLSDYGMENQACIVSDYWLLKTYGFGGSNGQLHSLRNYDPSEPTMDLLSRYEKILGTFPL